MVQAEKPKPKKQPKPKLRDKAQSERFIEAARKLGIEETASFDNAFTDVVKSKKRVIIHMPLHGFHKSAKIFKVLCYLIECIVR